MRLLLIGILSITVMLTEFAVNGNTDGQPQDCHPVDSQITGCEYRSQCV
jgi:hypothetical protein